MILPSSILRALWQFAIFYIKPYNAKTFFFKWAIPGLFFFIFVFSI